MLTHRYGRAFVIYLGDADLSVINWGRYAELFAFQEDRGMFRLEEEEEPLTRPVS